MHKRKYTDEELQNKTFHHLKLVRSYRKSNARGNSTRIFWQCECVCGKHVDREESTIVRGLTQSCGCKHPRHNAGKDHPLWQGIGELNGHYLCMLKQSAKKRDILFNLTKEYIWNLFIQQKAVCALTGLSLQMSSLCAQKKGIEQTASLDRIDSNKSYEEGNVQWIHKDINLMKNHFNEKYFIEMCKLVVKQAQENQSQNLLLRLPDTMVDYSI